MESPWEPLHVELGYDPEVSTVTVMRAETAINVTGGLPDIASVMGSAASYFTMRYDGKVAVLVAPHVAQTLAAEGWTKADVRRYLYEQGRVPAAALERSWMFTTAFKHQEWPAWIRQAAAQGAVPAVRDPDDIVLVVAGGTLPIPQNVYFPSWGFPPCRITRVVKVFEPTGGQGVVG